MARDEDGAADGQVAGRGDVAAMKALLVNVRRAIRRIVRRLRGFAFDEADVLPDFSSEVKPLDLDEQSQAGA